MNIPIESAREKLILTALRIAVSERSSEHSDVEYLNTLLAFEARELVDAIDMAPSGEQPIGWLR
jgi:hypothetical protein